MKAYIHLKDMEIPIYRGYFVIILTNSSKKVRKYFPDFHDEQPYAHSLYNDYKGKQGYIMVLNFDHPHRNIKHGVITHESIHLTHFLADLRGFKPTFENDEPITYLAEWITDEVYKFVKEKGYQVK